MKFLRRNSNRHSKLGNKRKKKQKWRRPTGRHNKMREKRKGRPAIVGIGYKKKKEEKKEIFVINNVKELERVKKGGIIILGDIGKKKKIEIAKRAKEGKIQIQNLNAKTFLERNKEKKPKEKPENKQKSKEKKK